MPVPTNSSANKSKEGSPSLKTLKLGNIIQRSASAESLRVLDEEKKAERLALEKKITKTGFRLWYYRFQLLTGSYMLDSWESAIFNVFVLLCLYVCSWNVYKLFKFISAKITTHLLA